MLFRKIKAFAERMKALEAENHTLAERVGVLETDKCTLAKRVEACEQSLVRTVSQKTREEEEPPTPQQILHEWLNGEEDGDNGT